MSEYFTKSTYAGKHILLDLWGCDTEILTDSVSINNCLQEAARKSGATVLFDHFHHFGDGEGCTGVIVLAESHISIHTWPESNFASIDIFMCGSCDPEAGLEIIHNYFQPKRVTPSILYRGIQSV